jgi:phosphoenolpyruvate synthase (EC 2.7.9.2)
MERRGQKKVPVSEKRKNARVLSEEEIGRLAALGKLSEDHYGTPQDIEWGIVGDDVYILQSRPITTIKPASSSQKKADASTGSGKILIEGQGASPGIATGRVAIIQSVRIRDRSRKAISSLQR